MQISTLPDTKPVKTKGQKWPSFFDSTKTKIRTVSTFKPILIGLGVVVVVFLVLTSNLAGLSYNSDDVAQQTFVHNLTSPGPHLIEMENDNYIIKFPAYLVINLLTHPGIAQLVLESVLLNVAMIILLSAWWVMLFPKTSRSWLVFLWLLSSGTYWMAQTVNPDTRNIEVGLMVIFGFYAISKLQGLNEKSYKNKRSLIIKTVLFGAIGGGLTYNDPYLLFFVLLPLFVATLIYSLLHKDLRPTFVLSVGLYVDVVIFLVLGLVLARHNLRVTRFNEVYDVSSSYSPYNFTLSKIFRSLRSFLSLFGINISFSNFNIRQYIEGLANLSIVILAGFSLYDFIRNRRFSLRNLWIICTLVLTFIYVIGTGTPTFNTVRYFIILIPITAMLVLVSLTRLKEKQYKYYRLAVLLISLSIVLNAIGALTIINSNSSNEQIGKPKPNSIDFRLVAALNANEVTNSYGNYWIANVAYYLSGYKDNILPTVCRFGKVYKDPVLVDIDRFNFTSSDAGIIVSPKLIADMNSPYPQSPSCTMSATLKQFGNPTRIVDVSSSVSLLVYDHRLNIPWRTLTPE